jgi:hypothetical protein
LFDNLINGFILFLKTKSSNCLLFFNFFMMFWDFLMASVFLRCTNTKYFLSKFSLVTYILERSQLSISSVAFGLFAVCLLLHQSILHWKNVELVPCQSITYFCSNRINITCVRVSSYLCSNLIGAFVCSSK